MIREQSRAQGPTRGIDQLVRGHGPWIVFSKEASEVHAGNQSVYERI